MTTENIRYEFGTMIETVDGKEFHIIAQETCDSDAQAELTARQIGEEPEKFDITDIDGNPLASLLIRRDDATWAVSI